MPIKTEYSPESDPSKQLSRMAVRNFIWTRIPKDERKQAKMACFPSAGFHDVYEISDPLGILRYNVTGIESDSKVYKMMEKNNPGIKLFHGTDREFFETTKDRFRIVSLDYTDNFDNEHKDTLDTILGLHILGSDGILHTNFYGSREKESAKQGYIDVVKEMFTSDAASEFMGSVDRCGDITEATASIHANVIKTKKMLEKLNLQAMRNMIASNIISSACSGSYRMCLSRTEKNKPDYKSHWMDTEFFLRKVASTGAPKIVGTYLLEMLTLPYFCDGLESYRYVSSSGSPMLTDIFDLNTHPELYRFKGKLDTRPNGIFLNDIKIDESSDHPLVKSFVNQARRSYKLYQDSFKLIKEREFLGSSTKPRISKEKARELIKRGVPSEEMLKTYRGVTKQQLAGYKAWKTMKEK